MRSARTCSTRTVFRVSVAKTIVGLGGKFRYRTTEFFLCFLKFHSNSDLLMSPVNKKMHENVETYLLQAPW